MTPELAQIEWGVNNIKKMSSNTNIHKDFITGFSAQDNEIPNKFIISFKTSNQPNFSSRAKMVLEDLGLPSSNSKLYKNINMMTITLPEKSRRQLTRKLYKRDDIRVEADRLISIAAPPPGKGKNKEQINHQNIHCFFVD